MQQSGSYRVRHLTFVFSTKAYFVNVNTQLMSDLTDNQSYPSAERIQLCIRLNNARKCACDRLTEHPDFGKKIVFSTYVNNQNCSIWRTENPHAYIEKPTHPKRITVWCGYWFRGIIGTFFFENEQIIKPFLVPWNTLLA